ncbi:MAG: hypothetical protein H0W50_12000 [Parachlamydiaceae bacterium]|nr:hypothetical protein [Parachlamydiaceae bacterium]
MSYQDYSGGSGAAIELSTLKESNVSFQSTVGNRILKMKNAGEVNYPAICENGLVIA